MRPRRERRSLRRDGGTAARCAPLRAWGARGAGALDAPGAAAIRRISVGALRAGASASGALDAPEAGRRRYGGGVAAVSAATASALAPAMSGQAAASERAVGGHLAQRWSRPPLGSTPPSTASGGVGGRSRRRGGGGRRRPRSREEEEGARDGGG
ncbi:hypothetical protein B0H15DRAFT_853688 [Mycena belliarum]|uniref:Uncharacterized protein n=1 Tax=Mycena belliarum TaxID=1033014 RepID=A0AAD6TW82_9AGAR|nr:hypothetical protein B0H15DRAFT_853688 [Mycena belliae]